MEPEVAVEYVGTAARSDVTVAVLLTPARDAEEPSVQVADCQGGKVAGLTFARDGYRLARARRHVAVAKVPGRAHFEVALAGAAGRNQLSTHLLSAAGSAVTAPELGAAHAELGAARLTARSTRRDPFH